MHFKFIFIPDAGLSGSLKLVITTSAILFMTNFINKGPSTLATNYSNCNVCCRLFATDVAKYTVFCNAPPMWQFGNSHSCILVVKNGEICIESRYNSKFN